MKLWTVINLSARPEDGDFGPFYSQESAEEFIKVVERPPIFRFGWYVTGSDDADTTPSEDHRG